MELRSAFIISPCAIVADENIGATFAMLCGAEEDQALADLGARVYQYVTRKIRGLIGEIQFAEVC